MNSTVIMTTVDVLIEGYAKEKEGGWLATATTTLIEDNELKVLVDPGINRQLLLDILTEQGFTLADIDYVFMTHYHPDHVFLCSLFENSLILDGNTIYQSDQETEYSDLIPETNVEVITTPGHTSEHCSLVADTNQGTVVIAGDVFWWMEDEDQATDDYESLIQHPDTYAQDWTQLIQSRQQILEIADLIIPGHGLIFENIHQNE